MWLKSCWQTRVNPDEKQTRNILHITCEKNHAHVVKYLIAEKEWDPSMYHNHAISTAASNRCYDTVKVLLSDPRTNPSDNLNALASACSKGDLEMVKLLLADKRCDPSAFDNYALYCALVMKNLGIVKLLLLDPRVNPCKPGDFNAIAMASRNGDLQSVKLFLAHKCFNSQQPECQKAIQQAIEDAEMEERDKVLQLLYPHSQKSVK